MSIHTTRIKETFEWTVRFMLVLSKKWEKYKLIRIISYSRFPKVGWFLKWIIMNGNSRFRRQSETCAVLGGEQIFIFQVKQRVHIRTYRQYTPAPPVRTLYGRPFIFYMIHFSLNPRNFDIIKYTKPTLTAFFIFPALPTENHLQLRH